VRHSGRVVGGAVPDTNLAMPRVPSPLEIAYLVVPRTCAKMVATAPSRPVRASWGPTRARGG